MTDAAATPQAAPPAFGLRDGLVAGAAVGAVAGLAESLAWGVRKTLSSEIVPLNPHAYWGLPVLDAAGLAVVGAAAAAIALALPQRFRARTAMALVLVPAVATVVLAAAPEIHRNAVYLLAAGAAFQLSRVAVGRWDAFVRGCRRALVGAAVAVALLAVGVQVWRAGRGATPQGTAAPGAPNVLLVVLDTVRAADTSVFGGERDTTPNLRRLAERGAAFERAYTTAPWTLPTHASIFTGRTSQELGVRWTRPLDDRYRTIAESFTAHGYDTAGFVGNVWYCSYFTGLDRGFAHYRDYGIGLAEALEWPAAASPWMKRLRWWRGDNREPELQLAPQVLGALERWIAEPRERPFFAFVNLIDAHEPYLPPPPFDAKFGDPRHGRGRLIDTDRPVTHAPEEVAAYRAQYDGAIAYLDHEIGRLLDDLERRGLADDLVVAVTADHGEEFFEHGLMTHGSSLYVPSLHVPLVVAMPGRVPAGTRVSEPVGLASLGPTLLELAGLRDEAAAYPARSLAATWDGRRGATPEPAYSFVNTHEGRPLWWPAGPSGLDSVVLGPWHLIRRETDGHEWLFRLDTDPWEQHDVAADPAHADALAECRRALDAVIAKKL